MDGIASQIKAADEAGELHLLRQLKQALVDSDASTSCPDVSDDGLLAHASLILLPAEGTRLLTDVVPELKALTAYLFDRRYGRTQLQEAIVDLTTDTMGPTTTASAGSRVNALETERHIQQLLGWLLLCYRSQPYSPAILSALVSTATAAKQSPVVRKNICGHIFDWLATCELPSKHDEFSSVVDGLWAGLTDVWSAIRNACAARLAAVLKNMNLQQVDCLFSRLIETCLEEGMAWQSVHGALQGVSAIIRKYYWITKASLGDVASDRHTASSTDALTDRSEFVLMFGEEPLHNGLPDSVRSKLTACVFQNLAHKQLSVREQATKAFSAFLSRSQFREALAALNAVVKRLRLSDTAASSSTKPLKFVAAYEAEGLLGVCLFIIKHIEPGFLLPNWPMYFSTLDKYLMHPASTVRQATSSIFKFLVSKDSSNPIMLKLVLQGLAAHWECDTKVLLGANAKPASAASMRTIVKEEDLSLSPMSTWEWLEGRLLAYELILKFALTNHVHYLFPPTLLAGPYAPGGVGAPHRDIKRRLPIPEQRTRGGSHQLQVDSFETDLNRSFERTPRKRYSEAKNASMPVIPLPQLPQVARQLEALRRDRAVSDAPQPFVAEDVPQRRYRMDTNRRESTSSLTPNNSSSSLQSFTSLDSEATSPSPTIVTPEPSGYVVQRPRNMQRRMSQRSITLHQHIKKIDTVKPDQPFRRRRSLAHDKQRTLSLLSHTQAMDLPSTQVGGLELAHACLQSPLPDELVESVQASPKTPRRLAPAAQPSPLPSPTWIGGEDAAAPAWVDTSRLLPLTNVLWTMLLQTSQAMGSEQFELKRIGKMVMPLLVEMLRWYDFSALDRFWALAFQHQDSWIAYSAALSFRYTLNHSAWLIGFLKNPPKNWRHPEACQLAANMIVGNTLSSTGTVLPHLLDILKMKQWDQCSLAALDNLLLLTTFFQDHLDDLSGLEHTVVNCMLDLYCAGHKVNGLLAKLLPDSQARKKVFGTIVTATVRSAVATTVESASAQALAAFKVLLSSSAWILPSFLDTCNLDLGLQFLPLVLFQCCQTGPSGADGASKTFFEAVHRVLDRAGHVYWFRSSPEARSKSPSLESPPAELENRLISACDVTTNLLLDVFVREDAEPIALRRTLDILKTILVIDSHPRRLPQILRAVAIRTRQASAVPPEPVAGPITETLQLLSGHTPASEPVLDSDSEEEDGPVVGSALNMSNGHLSIASADDDSDWDSWEEAETDESTLRMLAEFVNQAQVILESEATKRRATSRDDPKLALSGYNWAIAQLAEIDQTAVRWVREKWL